MQTENVATPSVVTEDKVNPLQSVTSCQRSIYAHDKLINTVAAVLTIVGAVFGAIVYVDHRIESKILAKIEPYQEFTTALALQQNNFHYNAAHKLNKLYHKLKTEDNTELLPPLVTALLQSIAESGYQEEFLHTVEQVQKDHLVPLQRHTLNDIGFIYLAVGQLDNAERILIRASASVEAPSLDTKTAEAVTHWRLALVNLTRGDVDSATANFLRASKISPNSYKRTEFYFPTPKAAAEYTDNDTHLARMKRINPQLDQLLCAMSRQVQQAK